MSEIRLSGFTLEQLRDALDFAVEMDSPEGRCCGIADWDGGTLEIDSGNSSALSLLGISAEPELRLASRDGRHARYSFRHSQWEVYHRCDECDREEWTEDAEWECTCGRVLPLSADPDGWRE